MAKTCSRCRQPKPVDEFYRHGARPDGRATWCKECSQRDPPPVPKAAQLTCRVCEKQKKPSAFPEDKRRALGRSGRCTKCRNTRRKQSLELDNKRLRKRRREGTKRNKDYIWGVLRENACVDCGEDDPLVLEFDHQRDKKHSVSYLLRHGTTPLKDIKAEVAKCVVRCANCHRRKTAITGNNWRVQRLAKEPKYA